MFKGQTRERAIKKVEETPSERQRNQKELEPKDKGLQAKVQCITETFKKERVARLLNSWSNGTQKHPTKPFTATGFIQ